MNKNKLAALLLCNIVTMAAFGGPVAVTNKTKTPLEIVTYDKENKISDVEIIAVNGTYSCREKGSPGRETAISKITWQNQKPKRNSFNGKIKRGLRTSYDFTKYSLKVDIGKDAKGYKLNIYPKGNVTFTKSEHGTIVRSHNNNNNNNK